MSEQTLPQGWVWSTLGDAANYGKTTKVEPSEIGSEEWVLELEDIEKDTSKLLQRINNSKRQSKSAKNRFKKGDVLYGKLRPYLNKVLLADKDGVSTTEIIPLSAPTGIDERYLFYCLKRPDFLEYVTSISHGLNMPRLGTKAGQDALFPLAPSYEQKHIADKLDALLVRVNACRDRLDHVPLILERFRQAVLAAATSGKLTEDWRKNSEVSYHDFDDETLSFPKSWTVYKVGDLVSLIDGDRGPNYPKQHDYLTTGHCLFLSTKNVRPFGFLFEDAVYISEEKHKTLRNGTLVRGDVIITTRGTLGNVAVYDESVPYSTVRINSGMLMLRNKGIELLNNFLKFYIASPLFSAQLNRKQSGSAQPQIPAGMLRTFLIPLPPLPEQHEIVRRVETLFAFADRLEARYTAGRKQVERLTPALLAKAFRGELVPQDPTEEPAEKLLDRIQAERLQTVPAPRRTTPFRPNRKT